MSLDDRVEFRSSKLELKAESNTWFLMQERDKLHGAALTHGVRSEVKTSADNNTHYPPKLRDFPFAFMKHIYLQYFDDKENTFFHAGCNVNILNISLNIFAYQNY